MAPSWLASAALILATAPLGAFAADAGIKEPKGSKVSVLNRDLFPRFIARNPLVLMEWYAPWCGHCQELAPKFREAADQLSAMKKNKEIPMAVKFAKMNDGDEYNHAGRFGAAEMYNFSSYPALYVFKDGEMLDPYFGGREVDDMVFWMASLAKGLDPVDEEIKQRPGLYKGKFEKQGVLDLSPETFNATVKRPASAGNNALWVVEFYSDRCPFCKSLSPEIVKAEEMLAAEDPRVRVAAVNTRIYYGTAEENAITGYPWVAAFYDGKKIEDMAGLGGADSIVNFGKRKANEVFEESLGEYPPKVDAQYDAEGVLVLDAVGAEWAAKFQEEFRPVDWRDAINEARSEADKEKKKDGAEKAAKGGKTAAAAAPAAPAKKAEAQAPAAVAVASDGEPSAEDVEKGAVWRAKLGRQTWFFLHTLAAKYPDYPSEVDMRSMRNFVAGLGQHYPCKLCRAHLKEKLMDPALGPVRVENRTALGVWFCELHNMVNKDTGKDHVHDCTPFALDLEYLKDCGECEGPKKPSGQGSAHHAAALGGTDAAADAPKVFDARLYAKDESQLMSEMSEAMEALAARAAELEAENHDLKARLTARGR